MSAWTIDDYDAAKGNAADVGTVASPAFAGTHALALTATSTSNGVAASQSPGSDMTDAWLPHAIYWGGYPSAPADTWYHVHVYFPTSYVATQGEWNFWEVWHIDDTTGQDSGGAAKSPGFTIDTWSGTPKIKLRWGAGPTSAPVLQSWFDPNALKLGHWYDELVHVVWSCNASQGRVQWWQDGTLFKDVTQQTLYSRSNGTCGYDGFGLYNYRLHATYPSTIVFDDVKIGPTQASVGG